MMNFKDGGTGGEYYTEINVKQFPSKDIPITTALHRGAKCPFIFRWGFGKPLLRIQGFTENKKCSPEKVSIIKYLQINTLHTQKLEFFCLELACPRLGQQKWFFGEC